jgi:UDP-GlcNAc3NAcA epimerase
MKKIVCIAGTRPQIIKNSILVSSLQSSFSITTLNIYQHYDCGLNDLLKNELYIDHIFHDVTLDNTIPAPRLGEMIIKISSLLQKLNPDAVLVYGDTDTTLAGALAANKTGQCLVHIEAGERSCNFEMPEEYNRIITDALSDILFCASLPAIENLKKEKNERQIIYAGDVMKDLALKKASLFLKPPINEEYIFCTIHRNYNQNNIEKINKLLDALQQLDSTVIFPAHPATLKTIEQLIQKENKYSNIRFLPPMSYFQSIHYQKFAKIIITDSGGIQKEAYSLRRPCITIRKETEWKETLKGNWNRLVYDDFSELKDFINLQPDEKAYDQNLYGNGNASDIIHQQLISLIN